MYPDEYIDYWGEEYQRLHIAGYRLSFERFLRMPRQWIAALRIGSQDQEPYPLLDRQLEVARRVAQMDAELGDRAVMRGDRLIEPLKRHCMPWKR